MPDKILETRIEQADEHQKETSANLEVLVQQNEDNNPNPNLEVLISQNDENSDKVVKAIKSEKAQPTDQMMNFLSGFFAQMKGDKGDKGDVGKTGKDGSNAKEVDLKQLANTVFRMIRKPKDGVDGINGNDGKNGADAKVDVMSIVKMVLERMAKPKDGKNAKELNMDDIVNKAVSKFKNLKGDDRVSYNNLKDVPQLYRQEGAIGGISNTTISNDLGLNFVDDETPAGTLNGTNKVFTISETPKAGSLKVYRNGQRLRVTEDYTYSNKTITFDTAPESDEILLVDFRF